MKMTSEQREALDIILSNGEFETLVQHIEFLLSERSLAPATPTEQCGIDGVPWSASIMASGIAEEIVNHFSKVVPELMASRSGVVTEVEHESLSEEFLNEITQDLTEVLMGRDSGCMDPEDLDETNCSFHFVEEKLRGLLVSATAPPATQTGEVRKAARQRHIDIASGMFRHWIADYDGSPLEQRDRMIQMIANALDEVAASAAPTPEPTGADEIDVRKSALCEFRRELVGGALPSEEKDLTMEIKRVLHWVDSQIK